jgi:hypothetical protein
MHSGRRTLDALVATGAALAGLSLAALHPLSPAAAVVAWLLVAGSVRLRGEAWLALLMAALPVVAFAPWSGWVTFEELDLWVLALAAGGYGQRALGGRAAREATALRDGSAIGRAIGSRENVDSSAGVGAVTAFVVLVAVAWQSAAMVRGFDDAGGLRFGLYHGLNEPMNSFRLAKPFLLAVLLWPLWLDAQRRDAEGSDAALSHGLSAGLALASLAALWERVAFRGLLDFSGDYRTTALFWEMNAGGAAFDGYLALTVPFATLVLLRATGRRAWLWSAAVVVLAAYACLTTFSRGVYFGVPVGVGVVLWLRRRQVARGDVAARISAASSAATASPVRRRAWHVPLLLGGFALGAALVFPGSGYRGVLALLGTAMLLLPLGGAMAGASVAEWLLAIGGGAVLSGLAVVVAFAIPKGAYVVYTLLFAATALLLGARRATGRARSPLSLAGYLGTITAIGLVALHWGDAPALAQALPVLGALGILGGATARGGRLLWPHDLRWQGGLAAAMAVVSMATGIFAGGDYMSGRFSTTKGDLDSREGHWRDALALLRTPQDLILGKGHGRFAADFALAARDGERPGDYRWLADDGSGGSAGGGLLALSGGSHVMGWGEILRVSQRVAPPQGSATLHARVRTPLPVGLHAEVCEKHLLYNGTCLIGATTIPAKPGQWQAVTLALRDGSPPARGAWYAPHLLAFSIAIGSSNQRMEVDDLALVDATGRDLLANGDFSHGMSHWFFTSDRYHLPWHAKNMALHVLVEQGAVGLGLVVALLAAALWRTAFGGGRSHPLAPAVAGALLAFLVIGATDSLLDVPRVAFAFYLLLLIGLGIGRSAQRSTATPRSPPPIS